LGQLQSGSAKLHLLPVLETIRTVLSTAHYSFLASGVVVVYSLFYMVFTGILSYVDFDLSTVVPIPYLQIYLNGPIGTVPSVVWAPTNNLVFSINLSAALFIVTTSLLVGVNAALLVYSMRIPRCNCKPHAGVGVFGMVSGLISTFACCGGGMLMALTGASFALFVKYADAFIISTLLILGFTTVALSSRIRRAEFSLVEKV